MTDFLTVPEAAAMIGCSRSFLWKKCKEGELPSLRVGSEYRIRPADLTAWVTPKPAQPPRAKKVAPEEEDALLASVDAWKVYLTRVKALSPRTLDLYQTLLRSYLKRMGALGLRALGPATLFERKTVMAVFSAIPAKSFNTKMNTHIMLRSFGTFLVGEGRLAPSALDDLKPMKPRRQVEPRRLHLNAEQVARLFDVIMTRRAPIADNITMAAMVAVMLYAGLRVSEVCDLRPQDVDLEGRVLTVVHGKGGKTRRVGISGALLSFLDGYERCRRKGVRYFLRMDGTPWDKDKVGKRMQRISRCLGTPITCHGLRRSFATLASNQGRSVNAVRIALGHTSLETTMAYLRTSESEVIEAMKDW